MQRGMRRGFIQLLYWRCTRREPLAIYPPPSHYLSFLSFHSVQCCSPIPFALTLFLSSELLLLPMETIAHRDPAKELENAKGKKAAFSIQANSDFDGSLEMDAPIPGRVISYKAKDGLQIMDKYNDDWWIGIKDGEVGFVPSPTKLKSLRKQAQN